ncbi:Alpha/Beta hydrolase protein [Russula earlei]|uniref:Alpha/Beta hydrolase protein n=1 Tax=Russula earlei TaxID=71964 RepID=A0ACC0UD99_9AGAM|nr:Alpha/Beta hydrolase protein [Russula earlei]
MSPWIGTRVSTRLLRSAKRCSNALDSPSVFPRVTATNILHTASSLLQPSADAPSGWLVLSAFVGLPIALWAYKCLMLIIFQRKMIYMGYAPPGSRTESLRDVYPKYTPRGIHIEELTIPSSQPNTVRLSTLLLRRDVTSPEHVVVYCQGNAGNPLHRIPVFATLLDAVPSLAILAPAPRSYWTSSAATPTQAGLTADYAAALAFASSFFPTSRLTIYGHSLGASIALCLLSSHQCLQNSTATVHGLVLENAFTSVPEMLRALYPQRWLPYRYLGPFVRDRWDARAAAASQIFPCGLARRAMVLVSERDEIVPPAMSREIFNALQASGDTEESGSVVTGRMRKPMGRFVVVTGALHEDAWQCLDWSRAIIKYLEDLRREQTEYPL